MIPLISALAFLGAPPGPAGACLLTPDPEPPAYYAFPLVSPRRVPGTGTAVGTGDVAFASSPFGITLAPDGSYLLDVHLSFEGLRPPAEGAYVAWITTRELDRVARVGVLDGSGRISGQTAWNKFLVVVTLEPTDDPAAEIWSGPVVLRGMSRSGMMHTMAGHGPFEQENCAKYGYE